jgi:hypothetical protein
VRAAARLGDWGAGVIPSISPTCSGVAMESFSAYFPAAGTEDWHSCLRVLLVRGAGWP